MCHGLHGHLLSGLCHICLKVIRQVSPCHCHFGILHVTQGHVCLKVIRQCLQPVLVIAILASYMSLIVFSLRRSQRSSRTSKAICWFVVAVVFLSLRSDTLPFLVYFCTEIDIMYNNLYAHTQKTVQTKTGVLWHIWMYVSV